MISVRPATTPDDIAAVKAIFEDYLRFIETYLGQDLEFQGVDKELKTFPKIYDALFLATLDGAPVAACGIKPFKDTICELKRLYCRPEGRGRGLGHRLTDMALTAAKTRGYTKIYLDTDAGLTHANAIYESLGFKDIDRYYGNPMDSRFMSKDL